MTIFRSTEKKNFFLLSICNFYFGWKKKLITALVNSYSQQIWLLPRFKFKNRKLNEICWCDLCSIQGGCLSKIFNGMKVWIKIEVLEAKFKVLNYKWDHKWVLFQITKTIKHYSATDKRVDSKFALTTNKAEFSLRKNGTTVDYFSS